MKTLFSIFFVIVLFTNSYSQIEYLAGKQYKKMNGLWYAIGDENEYSMVDTNHIIIRFKDKINISNFNFENIGVKNLKVISGKYSDGFYEVELPPNEDKFGILTKLEKSGYFEDVFFNIYYKIDSSPDDDLFSGQWNMTKINMLDAWDITTGSSSIIVAVIDVGFDYNNIDLTGHIWTGLGYDFLDNDADPYPYDGSKHGTAVAGIIGASTSNGEGVAGIAGGWNGSGGIKLMLLRAGNDQNGMSNTAVSQAIDYAVQNNANVISMSLVLQVKCQM